MSFLERFISKPDAEFQVEIPPEMLEGMTMGGTIAQRISRREALQVPAVLRARNLICSTLGRLPVHIRDKERKIAIPTTLLEQIDPDVPNVVTFSQTYEDLLFEGESWWRITDRGFHGYPTSAEHLDPGTVYVAQTSAGPRVYVNGLPVSDEMVIRFDSPNPPLLVHAARAIRACLMLDATAANYAEEPLPLGYFTPRDGIRPPKEDDERIKNILDKWAIARRAKAWGYVPAALELQALQFNAEQIQLSEQRQHAVLEIARATGLDPEDLGVSTTSRTYQNAEQRRLDLLDFTLAAYSSAVEQRLSMGDVTPRGYRVKVNFDSFLRTDTLTRMQAYQTGKAVGAYTEEEIRELEDRPALSPTQRARIGPQSIPEQNGQAKEGATDAVAR